MTQGFFNFQPDDSRVDLRSQDARCHSCGLSSGCLYPQMPPSGEGKRHILVVAEAPGRSEDEVGKQLIGKAGQRLRDSLEECGIDLDRDCRKTNAVICRPPENRTPTPKEVKCCQEFLWSEISGSHPKVIIPLGGTAVSAVIGSIWKRDIGGVTRWRGWTIPDRTTGAWICPTYHPSYVARQEENYPDTSALLFQEDLRRAIAHATKPLPKLSNESEAIVILESDRDIVRALNQIQRKGRLPVAVDFETTGLWPEEGHRIITAAVCSRESRAYAFTVNKRIKPALAEFMANPDTLKIGSNIKFESQWTRAILKVRMAGWYWDTMIAAHVLDNRPDITGLKFQAYVHFGIADYEADVARFMDGDENGFNHLMDMDRSKLLLYNGMDALLSYRLFLEQSFAMGIRNPLHG